MPRIRCRYIDCTFLESGYCGADQIDLDPEMGCLTYSQEEEVLPKEEEWEEEELDEEEWEEDLDEELDDGDLDEDEEDEDW